MGPTGLILPRGSNPDWDPVPGGGGPHHTYCFGAQVSERLVPTALDFTTFSWLPLLGLGM